MVVYFDKKGTDVNDDGREDINDVVILVNNILGEIGFDNKIKVNELTKKHQRLG